MIMDFSTKKGLSFWVVTFILFQLIGLIAYFRILNNFFSFDMFFIFDYINQNGFFEQKTMFYRPLTHLFFTIQYQLFGTESPLLYNLTSVIIHSAVSFCIFILFKLVFSNKNNTLAAVTAALLFLIHPSHSEPVSTMDGTVSTLPVLFILISLCFYIYYRQHQKRLLYLIFSLLFYAFGLASKELSLALPLVILCYEFFFRRINARFNFKDYAIIGLPFFVLTLFFIILRYMYIGQLVGGYGELTHLNFSFSRVIQCLAVFFPRVFLPSLPFDDVTIFEVKNNMIFPIALVLFHSILFVFIILKRRKRNEKNDKTNPIKQGIWFLLIAINIGFLPVLTLGAFVNVSFGERLIYLSSVFSSCLIAILVNKIKITFLRNIIITLICIFYIVFLNIETSYYTEASEISRNLVNDIKTIDKTENLYILNIPFWLNGALILDEYRLDGANRVLNKEVKYRKIVNPAVCTISSVEDEFTVSKNANKFHLKSITPDIRSGKPETVYFGGAVGNPLLNNELYKIELLNRNEISIELLKLQPQDKVLYYSKGRFIEIHYQSDNR